jgi:hypothetical protein
MTNEDEYRKQLMRKLDKNSNAIIECCRLLSQKLWKDDMEPSDFVVAGLVDAVVSTAEELGELLDSAHRYIVNDNVPQNVEQEVGATE